MVLQIQNSFCSLKNVDVVTRDLIARVLTYKNDIEAEKGQIFNQIRRTKYNIEKLKSENERDSSFIQINKPKLDKLYKSKHASLAKLKALEANEWVCWLKNDTFPTGHLNIVKTVLQQANVQYNIDDQRDLPGKDGIFTWKNQPFTPRYYQKNMIELGVKAGRGVFESAVGTGKSLIMANIIKQQSVNCLVIVPSVGLSGQLYEDFSVWFGHNRVQIVDTDKVRSGRQLKPIRIITVQSLASLQKSGEIHQLVADINAIHVDEIHHAGASSYTDLLPSLDHVYYRFGYTGTFLRNDSKSLDMWGFLSNVLYRYSAKQAIQDGFLTPLTVLVHNVKGKRSMNYQKEYNNCYCGNNELLNRVHTIHASAQPHEQVLTLVSRKDKGGKVIHDYLNNVGIPSTYISGDNKRDEITETISNFNDKKIKNLIGSSVIGEGIDVRAAHHMLMCQGGKSEIVITQATGRLVRLDKGKEMAYLHDFDFKNTRYQQKHLKQRLDIYVRNFGAEIKYVNN